MSADCQWSLITTSHDKCCFASHSINSSPTRRNLLGLLVDMLYAVTSSVDVCGHLSARN